MLLQLVPALPVAPADVRGLLAVKDAALDLALVLGAAGKAGVHVEA